MSCSTGMKVSPERVRLLIVDNPTNRNEYINLGATSIVRKWPDFLTSMIWCIIFYLSIITSVALLCIIFFIHNQGRFVGESFSNPRSSVESTFQKLLLENPFCNRLRHLNKLERHMLSLYNSRENIFFLQGGILSRNGACSLESVLRFSPNKTIFLMELNETQPSIYKSKLKKSYSNIVSTPINSNNQLYNSAFDWQENIMALYIMSIFTVWQFGGTVISSDLIMVADKKTYENSDSCSIDRDILSCPIQCAAFVYELLQNVNNYKDYNKRDDLLNSSIESFCGSAKKECAGVKRMNYICRKPGRGCAFVRYTDWAHYDKNLQGISKFCPIIRGQSQPMISSVRKQNLTGANPIKREVTTGKNHLSTSIMEASKALRNPRMWR